MIKNAYLLGGIISFWVKNQKRKKKMNKGNVRFQDSFNWSEWTFIPAHVEDESRKVKWTACHPDSRHRDKGTRTATINPETAAQSAHDSCCCVCFWHWSCRVSALYFIQRSNALDSKLDPCFTVFQTVKLLTTINSKTTSDWMERQFCQTTVGSGSTDLEHHQGCVSVVRRWACASSLVLQPVTRPWATLSCVCFLRKEWKHPSRMVRKWGSN